MSQLQKARVLRDGINARYWDLAYARLLCELAVCAGLSERLAASVLQRFLTKRRQRVIEGSEG